DPKFWAIDVEKLTKTEIQNWVFVSFAQLWDAVTLALWVFMVEVNMATTGRPGTKMEHFAVEEEVTWDISGKVLAWLCEFLCPRHSIVPSLFGFGPNGFGSTLNNFGNVSLAHGVGGGAP
ncbi:hypothetical protein ACJX0J_013059, partial [Zea mays]